MITSSSSQKYFSISSGTVNVYSVCVDKNRKRIPVYQEQLSIDEKEKASRFKFRIDQERFIISRAVLRILSGYILKTDPKQIQFVYGEYGKPDYHNNQGLKFNLSHSGNMIVIGFVKDFEIGIDVEYIKTDFDVLEIAQSFFSSTEIVSLKKQPKEELVRSFFRCWTRKESFIKAEGSGLSFPLDKFTVSMDTDENAELLKTDWDFSERLNWNLFSFIPDAQYLGAVAIRNKLSRVKYYDWDVLIKHTKPTSNNLDIDF